MRAKFAIISCIKKSEIFTSLKLPHWVVYSRGGLSSDIVGIGTEV